MDREGTVSHTNKGYTRYEPNAQPQAEKQYKGFQTIDNGQDNASLQQMPGQKSQEQVKEWFAAGMDPGQLAKRQKAINAEMQVMAKQNPMFDKMTHTQKQQYVIMQQQQQLMRNMMIMQALSTGGVIPGMQSNLQPQIEAQMQNVGNGGGDPNQLAAVQRMEQMQQIAMGFNPNQGASSSSEGIKINAVTTSDGQKLEGQAAAETMPGAAEKKNEEEMQQMQAMMQMQQMMLMQQQQQQQPAPQAQRGSTTSTLPNTRPTQQRSTTSPDLLNILFYTKDRTFNMNSMTMAQIKDAVLFNDMILDVKTIPELIDYAQSTMKFNYCNAMEPYSPQDPTRFLLLVYRLLLLRPSTQELKSIVNHNNPYVRAIGFLMMRWVFDPKKLWEWCFPHLMDSQMLTVKKDAEKITVGEFVEMLLNEDKFFDLTLPRLPPAAFRNKKAYFMCNLEVLRVRAGQNKAKMDEDNSPYQIHSPVEALYDQGREWRSGRIITIDDSHNGRNLSARVEFDNGISEDVGFGMICVEGATEEADDDEGNNDRERSRSRGRGRRNKDRYEDPSKKDLTKSKGSPAEHKRKMDEYIQLYRSTALSSGGSYAAKPQGYKAMMATAQSNIGAETRRMTEQDTVGSWRQGERRGRDRGTREDREREERRKKEDEEEKQKRDAILAKYNAKR